MNVHPESCRTLVELLHRRADQAPESEVFIMDGKSSGSEWLWKKCLSFCRQLRAEEVKEKERVMVMVPNSPSFFIAFYGCMLSGATPVPVFPGSGTERLHQLAGLCGSRHLILPLNLSEKREACFNDWSERESFKIHRVSESLPDAPVSDVYYPVPEDVAFIQYTSGSSDFPKGIPLTHFNLMTNVRQMTEAMGITREDVFVSWLPVYHDMGLILNTMVPLFTGARLVLMEEGLHRVHSWLRTIEQYRGTFISAPDIAYRLCAKSIRQPGDYDLSSLRVALNASEPIHLQTYRLFEGTFNLKNVMASGYGLAEATVAVTMHPPSQPPRVDPEGYVSSGLPLKGIDIRIEPEPTPGRENPAGEILVKSPALMKGYLAPSGYPDPIDPSGYLHTGDIGYLDADGFLYVLSRKKNIIIQAGHTLYPDDVEQAVRSLDEIRNAAAIGVEDRGFRTENLYVFAELNYHNSNTAEKYHETVIRIVEKISAHFGLKPGKVYLMKPKTLPVTPNGKLRHSILKSMYINDFQTLKKDILYPEQH